MEAVEAHSDGYIKGEEREEWALRLAPDTCILFIW